MMPQESGPGPHREVVRDILADAGSEAIGRIELIKRVREVTGLGLKEAKEAVEAYYRLDGVSTPTPAASRSSFASDDNPDAVIERVLAEAGGTPVGRIDLIRHVREATGLGLKESKDAVDSYFRRYSDVQFRASRPGCSGGTALLLLGLGLTLAELWR